MGDEQNQAGEKEQVEEPKQTISKEEINDKIKYYWKEVETVEGFDKYKENWDKLDYYRDLKLKLYK